MPRRQAAAHAAGRAQKGAAALGAQAAGAGEDWDSGRELCCVLS